MKFLLRFGTIGIITGLLAKFTYIFIFWVLEGTAETLSDMAAVIKFEWLASLSQAVSDWFDVQSYDSEGVGITVGVVAIFLALLSNKK